MWGKTAAAALLFSFMFSPVWPARKKKTETKPFKAQFVTVHQEADKLDFDDKAKIMHLEGHVKLWQPDSTLWADKATYYLNTEEAEANGNIKMTNPDGAITGDHLHMYYREKRVVVDKNVKLVVTKQFNIDPKNKEFVDRSPVTVTADSVEYKWGDKIATAQGHVVVEQKDRKAWGDKGVYNETADELKMDGNVKLFRPPKDTLYCDHLDYLLKTNKAIAEGHVHGLFLVRKEAEKNSPSKKTTSSGFETPQPPASSPSTFPSPSATPSQNSAPPPSSSPTPAPSPTPAATPAASPSSGAPPSGHP